MRENELATMVVDLCIKIHKSLGPGLLESVYEEALCYELKNLGLNYTRQQEIAVIYEGIKMQGGFRADVIVEGKLLIELKSIECIIPVHMKLTNIKLGLLINFNEALLKDGIKRMVNNL